MVSVPYRGATFLNIAYQRHGEQQKEFPSPIGELHFSIEIQSLLAFRNSVFPSPIGELHFSIRSEAKRNERESGFRPLSGSYISQSFENSVSIELLLFSFRPLSGSYISQSALEEHLDELTTVSVPYRGATFLNTLKRKFKVSDVVSFRPLSGSYISQLDHEERLNRLENSFRPLSGSYISQCNTVCDCIFVTHVSVPYRGATFLNIQDDDYEDLAPRYVSVPYRGATFLNRHLYIS